MTPVLKLGFFPPADQLRAFAEAQPKRTHGAAATLGPVSQGAERPVRVVVLPPPHEEHLGLEQRAKRFPLEQLVSKQYKKKLSMVPFSLW